MPLESIAQNMSIIMSDLSHQRDCPEMPNGDSSLVARDHERAQRYCVAMKSTDLTDPYGLHNS